MPKTLCTALALVMANCGLVWGAPLPLQPEPGAQLPIVSVANGCGRGMFRTIDGACYPNESVGGRGRPVRRPPPCPRGYLRDPDPARPLCYPVF